jgi:hypothetical protein
MAQHHSFRANTKSLRKSATQDSLGLSKVVGFLAFVLSSEILKRTNAKASCDQHQRQSGQQQPPNGSESVCAPAKAENRL